MSKHHHLKTWPKYFQAILDGRKTFEIRLNDRNFAEGDNLCLEEWNPATEQYTGRILDREIGYLIKGVCGVSPDVCVFALKPTTLRADNARLREALDECINVVDFHWRHTASGSHANTLSAILERAKAALAANVCIHTEDNPIEFCRKCDPNED